MVNPRPNVPRAKVASVTDLRTRDKRCQRPSASSSSLVNGSPRRFFRSAPPARSPR